MINKTVIINRAVPGSGKTTITNCIVDKLKQKNISVSVHSTDEYFMVENKYLFDISKLGYYHDRNFESFKKSILSEVEVVVCDNTNIAPWQTKKYTSLAREYNYRIIFITLDPRELEKHIESQKVTVEKPDAHGVEEDILKMMIKEYYIYDDLLNKNTILNIKKHIHYKWHFDLNKKIKIGLEEHFDSDHVIRILPNEYKEAQKNIGNIILELVSGNIKYVNFIEYEDREYQLFKSILYNDIKTVRHILNSTKNLKFKFDNGLTVLEFVLFKKEYSLIKEFYKFFKKEISDYILLNYEKSIHLAVYLEDLDLVNSILEKKVDEKLRDINGDTVIHVALKSNNIEMIELLVKNKISLNIEDNLGNLPLITSLKFNNLDIIKFLIIETNKLNLFDDKLLSDFYSSVTNEIQLEALNFLFQNKKININNNFHNEYLYRLLLKKNTKTNKSIIKFLIDHGLNVNNKILENTSIIQYISQDIIKYKWLIDYIREKSNNDAYTLSNILTSFSMIKPIKYTTHIWDFGNLKNSEYKDFDGFLYAVKKQFLTFENELKKLSPNLHKKIYTFLIENNPSEKYSWCSKSNINYGWSSLPALKNHCNIGNKPDSLILKNSIIYDKQELTVFQDIIDVFKQEIEVRENFKNLETMFVRQIKKLGSGRNSIFKIDLTDVKFNRQFFTDVEKFENVLEKVFSDIKTRKNYPNLKILTRELEDRSVEIVITQIDSFSSRTSKELLERLDSKGDLNDIKECLLNLCDWSIESNYENESFRINCLHSNNVKKIVKLDHKPEGFSHIFRFYK